MAGTHNPVGEIGRDRPDEFAASIPTLEHLEGQQIGRYLIHRRLGGGGVATVYQAYDQVAGHTVALKLLPPNPDEATLNRFRREALMAGALRHPHIVRIFQVGTSARGGAAYLAMELVEGESLAGFLARQGALQPAESCNLLEPVAQALAFAHQHGIVHRDVKPGNILLRPVSPGTAHSVQLEALDHPVIPLLSDFGVARFLDAPELTSTGRTVGTPAFMAPEQCMGSREIDGRADIYALGTVLFRCVTGRLPFTGSMTQVLHAQVYEPVLIEEEVLHRLGPVAAILQRSLAKEPDGRYPDAAEMAADLAHAAQRTVGGQARAPQSAMATATLTLAAVDVVLPDEATLPVTVLVPGAPGATTPVDHLPEMTATSAARARRPRARWFSAAAGLVVLALLGTLGTWAWAWRTGQPRVTPTVAQLAVLAPLPTAQNAGSPTPAPSTAPSAAIAPTPVATQPSAPPATTPAVAPTAIPTYTPTPQAAVLENPQVVVAPSPTPDVQPTATFLPVPTGEAAPPSAGLPITGTGEENDPQTEAVAGVCANVADEFFMGALTQLAAALREAFRCPTAPAYSAAGSKLDFAQGFMLALDGSPYVYVYYPATGDWEQVVRRDETAPGAEAGGPPPPFAQVWGENQRRIALGDMLGTVPAQIDALVQVFTGGMLIGDRASGAVYAFPLDRLRL